MKLSEAIMKGCKKKPQGFGALFAAIEKTKIYFSGPPYGYKAITDKASCALGAALDGIGYDGWGDYYKGFHVGKLLWKEFPIIREKPLSDLTKYNITWQPDMHSDTIESVIIHLNDNQKWPREHIAFWLTVEEKLHEKEDEFKGMERELTDQSIKEETSTTTDNSIPPVMLLC